MRKNQMFLTSSPHQITMDENEVNMRYLNIQDNKSELILDTPHRNEILKDGPPESSKFDILGRGSYGVVFKAVYAGKQVAVKIMKNLFNGKSDAINNEANIIGCRHRNIVQLLKIESTANYGIVIMERFPGQCLQIILDTIELPLEHRIYITLDVTNALIYCHKREILHLDVKPQNVLVAFSALAPKRRKTGRRLSAVFNRNYICKLCDFGSSVIATDNDKENNHRPVQGTVRYMSPEALREGILTPAADVFSLGITMWQLKSRQLPYSWIECNEIVAYQVVKTHLRPTGKPPESNSLTTAQLNANNIHKNCLCEHFSSEISHRSLDHIRTMLEKTKTVSPFQPKKSLNHQRPQKLKHQISRSLIGTFQNTFTGLKENLLVDEMSCDILDEELNDDFPLTELFRQKSNLIVPIAENLYEELYMSCWYSEAILRPKTVDVRQMIVGMFLHEK